MNATRTRSVTARAQLIATVHETAPAGNVSLIAAQLTAVRCRWCSDDLEHCHDGFVVHASGDAHCIDATCNVAREAHHMIVSCGDVGCACSQAAGAAANSA